MANSKQSSRHESRETTYNMKLYSDRNAMTEERRPNNGSDLTGESNARPRLEASASKYFDSSYCPTLDELNDMTAIMKDLQITSDVVSSS